MTLILHKYTVLCHYIRSSSNDSWATHIQFLETKSFLNNLWESQGSAQINKVLACLSTSLQDKFITEWSSYVHRNDPNSKLRCYKSFKYEFGLENYLICTNDFSSRRNFCKLRTSAHALQIEVGRHSVPKTPINNRICKLCSTGWVEDEKHMMIDCPFYINERETLYTDLNFTSFHSLSPDHKFLFLMSCNNGDKIGRAHV